MLFFIIIQSYYKHLYQLDFLHKYGCGMMIFANTSCRYRTPKRLKTTPGDRNEIKIPTLRLKITPPPSSCIHYTHFFLHIIKNQTLNLFFAVDFFVAAAIEAISLNFNFHLKSMKHT